jgi:hypothetical protein
VDNAGFPHLRCRDPHDGQNNPHHVTSYTPTL